jgi:hypothetical protein
VAPADIRVRVSAADPAAAQRASAALHATGFRVEAASATPGSRPAGPRTVIGYDPRWDRSARSLAAALPAALLRPVHHLGPVLRVTLADGGPATVRPVRLDPLAGAASHGAASGPLSGTQELCP